MSNQIFGMVDNLPVLPDEWCLKAHIFQFPEEDKEPGRRNRDKFGYEHFGWQK